MNRLDGPFWVAIVTRKAIPHSFRNHFMRAEIQSIVDDIKQALALLRRHL